MHTISTKDRFKKSVVALFALFTIVFLPGRTFAQYCTPAWYYGCQWGAAIDDFTFNTISNLNTGCNNTSTSYTYFSTISTNVVAGQTYSFSIQSLYSYYPLQYGIWIDFNADGDFYDSGEYAFNTASTSSGMVTGTITIPMTSTVGVTRIRVIGDAYGYINSTACCSTSLYEGEGEDYDLNILAPAGDDVGISSIVKPVSGCDFNGTDTIKVTISNYGTNSQTGFDVHYQIGTNPVVTENIGSLTLASASNYVYSFNTLANLSVTGTYTIKSWTTLPNDAYSFNDTTTKIFDVVPSVGTFPYYEDFENGQGGWTSGGTNSSWAFGTPAKQVIQGAASGVKAWCTGGLSTSFYNANEQSYVLSPCYDFSNIASPFIGISVWWESYPSYDGTVLQSSIDGGVTWTTVGNYGDPFNWYNTSYAYYMPTGAQECWTGTSLYAYYPPYGAGQYLTALHSLSTLAGQPSVRLRIFFGSGSWSNYYDGFAFDNVYIDDAGDDISAASISNINSGCSQSSTQAITVNLQSYTATTMTGFNVSYSINNGPVVTENVGSLVLNSNSTASYTFATTADFSVPNTYFIAVWPDVPTDNNAYNDTTYFTVVSSPTVNTFPYSEDFENGYGGWYVAGTNPSWAYGTPAKTYIQGAASGSNAWVTGGLGTSSYNASEQSYVVSPCYDFSAMTSPFLGINVWWESYPTYDGTVIQSSTDGGVTWTTIGNYGDPFNWYNTSYAYYIPYPECWSGTTAYAYYSPYGAGQWLQALHSMSTLAGQPSVLLRVYFGSGSWSNYYDGFAFDDVFIDDAGEDISVSAASGPNSGCNMTANEILSCTLTSYTSNSHTGFNVYYQIDNGPVVSENVGSLVLPANGTASYTFSTPMDLSVPATYVVAVWTDYPGDNNFFNDTTYISFTHAPTISTFPYSEDFENGVGGWIEGGTNSSWAFGTPNKYTIQGASSGVNAWVTGGLGSSYYNASENSYVESPCFDFTNIANPWISMRIWWETYDGYDGAVLQGSIDGGITYTTIGNYNDPNNWYNEQMAYYMPTGMQECWSGYQWSNSAPTNYVTATHGLTGLGGQPDVRLRIFFGSGTWSNYYDGFAFDDVNIAEPPVLTLGNDLVLCQGDSTILDVTNPLFVDYNWSTTIFNNDSRDTIYAPGTYWVTATDSMGFQASDTITITYSPLLVNIGPDSLVCPHDIVTLDAGNAGSVYDWSTGDTSQTISFTYGGLYTVIVTDQYGCIKYDTISLGLKDTSVVDLGPDLNQCVGNSTVLNAGYSVAGQSYLWSHGPSTQFTQISAPGIYWVEVTTPGGCVTTDTMVYTVNPSPIVNFGPDTTVCGAFVLDAGNPGSTYVWNTNANTQIIAITQSGTFGVVVTNSYGCVGTDSIDILTSPNLNVNLGPNQSSCSAVTLNAGFPGSLYLWSTGEITQSINVSQTGMYTVAVSDALGCTGIDTVFVTVSSLSLDLGADLTVCGSVTLDAGNPGSLYNWSNGPVTRFITVTSSGNYAVTVTDGLGCTVTDNINVTVTALNASYTVNDTLYVNQFSNFTNTSVPAGNGWVWDFGDGSPNDLTENPTHVYSTPGVRTVTLIVYSGSCVDTYYYVVNVIYAVSVAEDLSNINNLLIYPNPSTGIFNVEADLKQASAISFEILDMLGRSLYSNTSTSATIHNTRFDLSGYAAGVYTLRMEIDGRVISRRITLQ